MKIEKKISVGELSDSLTRLYPNLILKAFSNTDYKGNNFEGDAKEVSSSTLLKELSPGLEGGQIVVSDSLTVNRLETILKNRFGLLVRVLRKSNREWASTVHTNGWTLQRQNSNREIEQPTSVC